MGVSQKKRKIYLYMWDYENYITDDKKKYTYTHTHTLKKGQSLIGEGTDGMANKSEEFFFPVTENSGQRSKIVDYHFLRYLSYPALSIILWFLDDQRPRRGVRVW